MRGGKTFLSTPATSEIKTNDRGSGLSHENGSGTYITVGEADNETVLGRIVLVLCLGDQSLASIVIGLSLTPTTVLGLVAGVVGAGLDGFGERLGKWSVCQS